MNLLLNHENIKKEINIQLLKLRRFALYENKKDDIDQLAEIVAKIHSYDLSQNNLPLYNSQWVIELVKNYNGYKSDVISALEMVSEMEYYNTDVEFKITDKKFLTWDIRSSNWHKEYESGHSGSYAWDIAAIINYVNDPLFSDIFLESYIQHGGQKPTLISIYVNLYYVKITEAVMNDNFKNVMTMTNEILKQNIFKTEIISYETLSRMQILGY